MLFRSASPVKNRAVSSKTPVTVKKEKPPLKTVSEKTEADSALKKVKDKWSEIIETVRKAKITCYAFFVEAKPVSWEEGTLYLQYKMEHKFHRERSELPDNKKVMEQALENILGEKIAVKCILEKEAEDSQLKLNPEDELVEKAIALFGGEVVEVE